MLHVRQIRQIDSLIRLRLRQVSSSRSDRVNDLARETRIHYVREDNNERTRGLVDYGLEISPRVRPTRSKCRKMIIHASFYPLASIHR